MVFPCNFLLLFPNRCNIFFFNSHLIGKCFCLWFWDIFHRYFITHFHDCHNICQLWLIQKDWRWNRVFMRHICWKEWVSRRTTFWQQGDICWRGRVKEDATKRKHKPSKGGRESMPWSTNVTETPRARERKIVNAPRNKVTTGTQNTPWRSVYFNFSNLFEMERDFPNFHSVLKMQTSSFVQRKVKKNGNFFVC